MNKQILVPSMMALIAFGLSSCSDDDNILGISGDTTKWQISDVQLVSGTTDECGIFDATDATNNISGEIQIIVDGSTVTFTSVDYELEATASGFSEQDNDFTATLSETDTTYSPCEVTLNDAFAVTADDPDRRIDNNDTLTVVWTETQTEISASGTACSGTWDVDLPCESKVQFTLTKTE